MIVVVGTDVDSRDHDQPGLELQYSYDGSTIISRERLFIEGSLGGEDKQFIRPLTAPFFRVVYHNGDDAQTIFTLETTHQPDPIQVPISRIGDSLVDTSVASIGKSILAGKDPDGAYLNVRIQGRHSAGSTIVPLNGDTGGTDHIFWGVWFPWQESYVRLAIDVEADVAGTIYIDFSQDVEPINGDNSSVLDSAPFDYDPSITPLFRRHIVVQSRWVRVRYVNGIAAQSRINLDAAYLISDSGIGLKSATASIQSTTLVGIVESILTAENESESYVHVKTTANDSGKEGLNTTITKIEDDILQRPLSTWGARQITLGNSEQRLDTDNYTGRRTIEILNNGSTEIFINSDDSVTELNGRVVNPGGSVSLMLSEDAEVWGICKNASGTSHRNQYVRRTHVK